MAIQQGLLHPAFFRIQHHGVKVHKGNFFHDHRIMHGFHGILTPGKGAVMTGQYTGDMHGIQPVFFKMGSNDFSGLQFVGTFHFFGSQVAAAGNVSVNIVRVCCPVSRDITSRLCPDGCPAAVGMDHAADIRKRLVQLHMGGGVAGGLPLPFHHLAVQIDHNHVLHGHAVIGHAGGLDDHKTALAVDAGDVAPCENDQSVLNQIEVGAKYFFFKFFKHSELPKNDIDKSHNGDDAECIGFEEIANSYRSFQAGKLAALYAGICYYQMGDMESAVTYLKRFSAKDLMIDPAARQLLGNAYVEMQEYGKAAKAFESAAKSGNDLIAPICLKKAGFAYLKMENKRAAKKVFESIKADYPASQEAQDIDKYIAIADAE